MGGCCGERDKHLLAESRSDGWWWTAAGELIVPRHLQVRATFIFHYFLNVLRVVMFSSAWVIFFFFIFFNVFYPQSSSFHHRHVVLAI